MRYLTYDVREGEVYLLYKFVWVVTRNGNRLFITYGQDKPLCYPLETEKLNGELIGKLHAVGAVKLDPIVAKALFL